MVLQNTEDLCREMLVALDKLLVDVLGLGKVDEFRARLVGVKTSFHNPKRRLLDEWSRGIRFL